MTDLSIPCGAIPVMLTPFDDAGAVNYDTLDQMVDLYIQAGVSAIFAVCLSSEMFHLTCEERLRIARRVCRRAGGAVPILVSGNFDGTMQDQAESIREMHGTGADAVVVLLSVLPSRGDIAGQLAELSELSDAPLGIYECPSPAHVQMSADEIRRIAPLGRYVFMKETSSDQSECIAKAVAATGTPLRVFPANLRCTPATLMAGGAGHCGIAANVCPEHCAAMCGSPDPDTRKLAQESAQLMHDVMCACNYLPAAKYILAKRGLNMGSRCRSTADALSGPAVALLDETLAGFDFHSPLVPDTISRMRGALDRAYPKRR